MVDLRETVATLARQMVTLQTLMQQFVHERRRSSSSCGGRIFHHPHHEQRHRHTREDEPISELIFQSFWEGYLVICFLLDWNCNLYLQVLRYFIVFGVFHCKGYLQISNPSVYDRPMSPKPSFCRVQPQDHRQIGYATFTCSFLGHKTSCQSPNLRGTFYGPSTR